MSAPLRIAITGRQGQVAQALQALALNGGALNAGTTPARGGANVAIVPLARPAFDLGQPASIAPALAAARADVVISVAAYTAVDRAEQEPALAHAINAAGPGTLAAAAYQLGLPLIHLSTDYVFDGTKPTPYAEHDTPAPLGTYGASKLAGERAVLAAHPQALVARTAWVYSPDGANFVKTMLRLASTRGTINVVDDQHGCPTSAQDLACALLTMAQRLAHNPLAAPRGLYHMAGSGTASWADVAEAAFAASTHHGGPWAKVARITTAQYPTPAPRPANSRLCCARLAADYGLRLPDWRTALPPVVAHLVARLANAA